MGKRWVLVVTVLLGFAQSVSLAALEKSSRLSESNYEPVRIAGMPVQCTDFRGRVVRTMRIANLGDVGRAWVVNTIPFIIMDRHVLTTLPPKLQLFFYGHECAHHVLGHWVQITLQSEREADCWSVKNGRDRGLFKRDEVAAFAPYLRASKGSRRGHLPGPQRAKFLLSCFDEE